MIVEGFSPPVHVDVPCSSEGDAPHDDMYDALMDIDSGGATRGGSVCTQVLYLI